jgi:RND family efflux transporter MFP subunit
MNTGYLDGRGPTARAESACAEDGRGRRRARALAAIGGSLLILAAGCQRQEEPPAEEIRPVRVITVGQQAASDSVSLTGTVQAQTEVNYAFRIDGRLIERPVNVGDQLRPGQLIARLDPSNEESSTQSARAQLDAANARLVEQRNNYGRQKELLERNFISRAAFDQVEANLRSAESAVRSARSQWELARNRLSYTRLVSDAGGSVVSVGAEAGEVVAAGRSIVQVARKGGRDAVFDVPARMKDAAPANPEITISLTSDATVSAKGRVREVAPRADPVTGTFRVRVGLIDPPPGLRLGSTVTGSMRVQRSTDIEIPGSALVRSGAQTAVWIVDPKTGTVSLRPITIASHDVDRIAIADGLEAGDVVVTAGVQALHPGQRVRADGAAK